MLHLHTKVCMLSWSFNHLFFCVTNFVCFYPHLVSQNIIIIRHTLYVGHIALAIVKVDALVFFWLQSVLMMMTWLNSWSLWVWKVLLGFWSCPLPVFHFYTLLHQVFIIRLFVPTFKHSFRHSSIRPSNQIIHCRFAIMCYLICITGHFLRIYYYAGIVVTIMWSVSLL